MKKIVFVTLLVLLFTILKTFGQGIIFCPPLYYPPYCQVYLDSDYAFEKVTPNIQIDTSKKRNQWQIATPHKIILDSALSPTHVLITDSINPIMINDTSITTLKIYNPYRDNIYLQFHHKYDIDSLHQKAFLECSYNNGNSWVLMDNYNYQPPCDIGDKYWTCDNTDSTVKGPYFYGTTQKWKTSAYFWLFEMGARLDSVNCNIPPPPDTMLVRFVFQNDSVSVPNEGWMIDNIDIYYYAVCGGVNTLAKPSIEIYPNPADNYIQIKNAETINSVRITNLYGQILISKEEQNLSYKKIDISSLIPGIYFIQCKDVSGNYVEEKFVKE